MNAQKMSTEAAKRLEADVRSVHEYRDAIGDRVLQEPDDRVLVVLSAGQDAEQLYTPSLRRLFLQIGETQRRANVVLVLNNGTAFPDDVHFPEVETVFLDAVSQQFSGMTAPVYKPSDGPDKPYILETSATQPHTLHVLRQPESPFAAGKINALRDAFGMLMHSCVRMGALPRTTLFMDAETHFYDAPSSHLQAPEEDSNGLESLLDCIEMYGAPHILGAKVRMCAYRLLCSANERVPNFDAPIADLHRANNWAHGNLGHRYFSGGAIAGRTESLLALGQTVAKYPGLRSEDTAQVALAERSGIPWAILHDTLYTNLCPPGTDRRKTLQQLARWSHGKAALVELYGTANVENASRLELALGRAQDFLYLVRNPSHALGVLQDKRDVRDMMLEYPPEHPLDGAANWKTV